MDIQLGYWRWKLFRWNNLPNPYRNRPDLAMNWLRQYQDNPRGISELRNLLDAAQTGLSPTTDIQLLLRQVADKLSSGEIQACVEVCGPVSADASGVITTGEAEPDLSQIAQEAAAPRAKAAAVAQAPPESVPESTLSPTTDPAAMAQVLKNAAQTGAPFCEECQKAMAAAAA